MTRLFKENYINSPVPYLTSVRHKREKVEASDYFNCSEDSTRNHESTSPSVSWHCCKLCSGGYIWQRHCLEDYHFAEWKQRKYATESRRVATGILQQTGLSKILCEKSDSSEYPFSNHSHKFTTWLFLLKMKLISLKFLLFQPELWSKAIRGFKLGQYKH